MVMVVPACGAELIEPPLLGMVIVVEESEGDESEAEKSGCGCGDASGNVDADRAGIARSVRGALHRQAPGGREFRGGESNHQTLDRSRGELHGTLLREERRHG